MASGSFGPGGDTRYTGGTKTNITMGTNEYPKGTIKISMSAIYLRADWQQPMDSYIYIGIGDSSGSKQQIGSASIRIGGATGVEATASVDLISLKGKEIYVWISGQYNITQGIGSGSITIDTAVDSYKVSTHYTESQGTLTANTYNATPGSTVTLYPKPKTGYQLSGYTKDPNDFTISNNQFTMPSHDVDITAHFSKKDYTVTLKAKPDGGGSPTYSGTPQYKNKITLSQTAADGYYFNGWTSSDVTISSNEFTMPDGNVTVTANYLRSSIPSLSKTNFDGGETIKLTLNSEKTTYTHKYQLSFGAGMETTEATIAANVTSVDIAIPISWCDQIPNQASKTGGTLTLKTYSGTTLIGTRTITGLVFNVPATVVPTITGPTVSIVRTIDGKTYANVGDYYVQNHSGVRVQASAAGARSSTIESIAVKIGDYAGSNYNKTVLTSSVDFSSKLLTISGSTKITVTATDSRARKATAEVTITVEAYNPPSITTFTVKRVDVDHHDDGNGQYAEYSFAYRFTEVGSNAATRTVKTSQGNATNPSGSGDLLPGDRKMFDLMSEHEITLEVQDLFEKTTLTVRLPTGKFMIYVDESDDPLNPYDRIAFGKVATKTPPGGKDGTFEISDSLQIYYGNDTLEDYIRAIVSNM